MTGRQGRIVFTIWALMLIVLALLIVKKAWPAENVSNQEDYAAIMEQAENWSVKDEGWDFGFYKKLRQDPQNSDQVMLTVWFCGKNRDCSLNPELFAKMLYLESSHRPGEWNNALAAMLKTEDGVWMRGDFYESRYGKYNGEDAFIFRLFDRNVSLDSTATRAFLFRDLGSAGPPI